MYRQSTPEVAAPPGPRRNRPIPFPATARDIDRLHALSEAGMRAGVEQFDADTYLDNVIPKPWGYEYRAYVDDFFDCWALHIESPHATSTHVHPRKVTYLLCLAGQGVTTGLSQSVEIKAGSALAIAPGAFHSTRSTGDEALQLIEVETPRNKFDLMRLQDGYQRAGEPYEADHTDAPHPMRPVRGRPHARIRRTAPDRRTNFAVRTGYDVFYRRSEGDMFYVPLSLSGAVQRDVDILTGEDGRRPDTDTAYLVVNRPDHKGGFSS